MFEFLRARRTSDEASVPSPVPESQPTEPPSLPVDESVTTQRAALLKRNEGRVCVVPFVRFDVWADGRVPVCCTDWMQGDVIIGNAFEQRPEEIWNSETAKRIRRSVTDGTFSHCTERCPLLAEGRLPKREDVREELKAYVENPSADLESGPEFVKLVNDDSCNLNCPSCRHDIFIESNEKSETIFENNMRVVYPMLQHAKWLDILGNGEAIASKATMKLLGSLDSKTHRNLTIDLLTNATKFNANAWERLSNIHSLAIRLNISADGASKATYEKLRRGGKWEEFCANMEFIADLRRSSKIKRLTLNFTVQSDNYEELPLFGAMARRFSADRVILFRISRWPHMGDDYFSGIDVFDEGHPRHADFKRVVSGIDDPIIEIGPLTPFRDAPC